MWVFDFFFKVTQRKFVMYYIETKHKKELERRLKKTCKLPINDNNRLQKKNTFKQKTDVCTALVFVFVIITYFFYEQ